MHSIPHLDIIGATLHHPLPACLRLSALRPRRSRPVVGRARGAPPQQSHHTSASIDALQDDSHAVLHQREKWAAKVRNATGRSKHRFWQPSLDPPALLSHVTVVLVAPKRPSSVGSVARALSCFECEDLRLVQPQCDHLSRSARNSSKGAQYLLWQAAVHDTLEAALEGTFHSVAFTRWIEGTPASFRSVSELMASPYRVAEPVVPQVESASSVSKYNSGGGNKVALVFGREVAGLTPEEVGACDAACSIPIGRLQESLSLSHAVSLALGPLFEAQQKELQRRGTVSGIASTLADLADGVGLQDD